MLVPDEIDTLAKLSALTDYNGVYGPAQPEPECLDFGGGSLLLRIFRGYDEHSVRSWRWYRGIPLHYEGSPIYSHEVRARAQA